MMPVARGEAETLRQILLYSVALICVSLLLVPVAGLSFLYTSAATLLGAGFLWLAFRLWRAPSLAASRTLFAYSIPYLGLIFVAVAADVLILG